MPSKNPTVGFRLNPQLEPEWREWERRAEADGVSLRDWLFRQVRAALAPKAPVEASRHLALSQGRRQGIFCGRLDYVFTAGREEDLNVAWVATWARKHPEDVRDVVQWLTAQPYGLRFRRWWMDHVAPFLERDESAHNRR